MRVPLKEFQTDAVAELADKLTAAKALADLGNNAAVLLNAPTGSGKTLIMTALIDQLRAGTEDGKEGDPNLVVLWLTDDPELNRQTEAKMLTTSGALTFFDLKVVDADVDAPTLARGMIYFLNTQKLGTGTSYVKNGDGRAYTLWQMIANTIAAENTTFILVIDEAHRGARGRDATEAETIMQKFMMGSDEIAPVPLVIGVSATPDRFVKLCNDIHRPLLRVDVPPEQVRESGLLKEYIDLYHPDEDQPNRATMLVEAVSAWSEYRQRWQAYAKLQGETIAEPVLLVQVEDARAGTSKYSNTDLSMVVATLSAKVPHSGTRWLAHAFQDNKEIVIDGVSIRHLAPSKIDGDPDVKVVLFKSSLNTGWDCPRAETMVSFRSAQDETNIAQLVGRMVRAPLARRVDSDEHLNTVALYLPFYDATAVKKVVERLTGDPSTVPPAKVREGHRAVTLARAPSTQKCFEAIERLPTYSIPRTRAMKPIPRLAKLAALLRDLKIEKDPVKTYRGDLVEFLLAERKRLLADPEFVRLSNAATLLEIRLQRIAIAAKNKHKELTKKVSAIIADGDLDLLHADSGRALGEGLHKEYLRRRITVDGANARDAKTELAALVAMPGLLGRLNDRADTRRKTWTANHKVAIGAAGEKFRQVFRDIEGAGSEPEQVTIVLPTTLEGTLSVTKWEKHLYVDPSGQYPCEFSSSWETRTVDVETKRKDVVGWLRNPDRKPWSVCAPRKDGTKWVGIYPDFIFLRTTQSGVICDVVDPHSLAEKDAPMRAAALAEYAAKHSDIFGRFEMVIFQNDADKTGKRIDLMVKKTRDRVAQVKTHAHLQDIFDQA